MVVPNRGDIRSKSHLGLSRPNRRQYCLGFGPRKRSMSDLYRCILFSQVYPTKAELETGGRYRIYIQKDRGPVVHVQLYLKVLRQNRILAMAAGSPKKQNQRPQKKGPNSDRGPTAKKQISTIWSKTIKLKKTKIVLELNPKKRPRKEHHGQKQRSRRKQNFVCKSAHQLAPQTQGFTSGMTGKRQK